MLNIQATISWVPAHAGIDGNEWAHSEARAAVRQMASVPNAFYNSAGEAAGPADPSAVMEIAKQRRPRTLRHLRPRRLPMLSGSASAKLAFGKRNWRNSQTGSVRRRLLPEVVALGAYHLKHVWAVTFKTTEGSKKLLAESEPVVKGLRCIVVDPVNWGVRLKIYWLLFNVTDDNVRAAMAAYGRVLEVNSPSSSSRAGRHFACGANERGISARSAASPSATSAGGSATMAPSASGPTRWPAPLGAEGDAALTADNVALEARTERQTNLPDVASVEATKPGDETAAVRDDTIPEPAGDAPMEVLDASTGGLSTKRTKDDVGVDPDATSQEEPPSKPAPLRRKRLDIKSNVSADDRRVAKPPPLPGVPRPFPVIGVRVSDGEALGTRGKHHTVFLSLE
ncbi:hypothetical protein HPB47_023510 [Ixodes persulcatus]|uniref:Uncharacterized protein n=1 Tax=Ixodes persulcatus TaxID=34615 RepID=A0AC60QA18_IXOPE|nr:hypothetical protein HPB47_023510 [Ixodes persulcatus]